jgi:hypothetical protein
MKTTILNRVAFGSAKALTQDGIGGEHTELFQNDSKYLPAG